MFQEIREPAAVRHRYRRNQEIIRVWQIFIRTVGPRIPGFESRSTVVDADENGSWNLARSDQLTGDGIEVAAMKGGNAIRKVEHRISRLRLRVIVVPRRHPHPNGARVVKDFAV